MSADLAGLVEQLRATLGKMEVALSTITDAIVWTGKDTKVQWCNAAFDKLVNRSHIMVLGAKLSDLLPLIQAGQSVPPELYPDVRVLGGEHKATEYEFQQGIDAEQLVLGHRSLILEISGNCVELTGGDKSAVLVIRDVTQAKRVEAERQQAEVELQRRARVDNLLSSVSRQFIDQDVDTAINFALQRVGEFTNSDRTYVFRFHHDHSKLDNTHEWCADGIQPFINEAQNCPVDSWSCQILLNGSVLEVSDVNNLPPEAAEDQAEWKHQSIQSLLVVPMILANQVVGCVGLDAVASQQVWSEETVGLLKLVGELVAIGQARHIAEEAMRVAKEAADATSRAKSVFLANMSHELRTPLNAILGFAQLMERDTTLTQRQREFLVTINRSGEHLLNLINDVLEMTKIEAGCIVLNPAPFDLYRLLQTIHEMFQVRAEAKQLSLQVQLAPDLPQYIFSDEGKLRQVLLNLLGNAFKFTDTGEVALRVSVEQSRTLSPTLYNLHFEIADTGKGIAVKDLNKLFQPFIQTASGTQVREGTGLGLTVSRQFVQLMGGDIHLTSVVGQGSTFRFDIKVEVAPSEVAPPTVIFNKMADHLGVQYIYADEQGSVGAEELRKRVRLKSSDLTAMPGEWVTALHQAAIQVDAELIFQLAEQIPKTHLALAKGLANLVHNFCFDEIIDLTQRDRDA